MFKHSFRNRPLKLYRIPAARFLLLRTRRESPVLSPGDSHRNGPGFRGEGPAGWPACLARQRRRQGLVGPIEQSAAHPARACGVDLGIHLVRLRRVADRGEEARMRLQLGINSDDGVLEIRAVDDADPQYPPVCLSGDVNQSTQFFG